MPLTTHEKYDIARKYHQAQGQLAFLYNYAQVIPPKGQTLGVESQAVLTSNENAVNLQCRNFGQFSVLQKMCNNNERFVALRNYPLPIQNV